MKSRYVLLSILVISIIIAILSAVYYGGFAIIKTPEERGKTSVENCTLPVNRSSLSACEVNRSVDFSKLRPLNTSLSKKDVLEIYRLVLTDGSCPDRFFLNPLAHPMPSPFERNTPFTYPKDYNYSALPKELKDEIPCDFEFAYIDDVYCEGKVLCNRAFITLSEPLILSDGTVVILKEFIQINVIAGLEYHLIRTSEGKWNATYIRNTFIIHPSPP